MPSTYFHRVTAETPTRLWINNPTADEVEKALAAVPIGATEVFAIDQAIAVCELYRRVAETTGRRPPFYVTHITGIFDEYLGKQAEREGIAIAGTSLPWAGSAVGRKQYRLLQERRY